MKKIGAVAFAVVYLLRSILGHAEGEAFGDRLRETAPAADGKSIRYVLTLANPVSPKFLVILMPGGSGDVSPEMSDGRLVIQGADNFLIRSRAMFADSEILAVSTDVAFDAERIMDIANDVGKTYPHLKVYVIGTSRSTEATMALAPDLDGKVAGFVHTSSMDGIAGFDTTKLKSRQLLVHHRQDGCKVTPYSSAAYNHDKYGTELITIEGGLSDGNPCKARGYHGYNGIENEVVGKIKDWIRKGE